MLHDLEGQANLESDHGDLLGDAEDIPQAVAEPNGTDQMDTEDSIQGTEETQEVTQAGRQPKVQSGSTHAIRRPMTDTRQEITASEEQTQPQSVHAGTPAPHDNVFAAMPQVLLGTGTFWV